MKTAPPSNGSSRSSATGRFASEQAEVEEQVVDYQAQLDEMGIDAGRMVNSVESALRDDERDDRRRDVLYERLRAAIVTGAPAGRQLEILELLVAHVEADELREDQERIGLIPALHRLAARAGALRRIFHRDFVPRILATLVAGRSRDA